MTIIKFLAFACLCFYYAPFFILFHCFVTRFGLCSACFFSFIWSNFIMLIRDSLMKQLETSLFGVHFILFMYMDLFTLVLFAHALSLFHSLAFIYRFIVIFFSLLFYHFVDFIEMWHFYSIWISFYPNRFVGFVLLLKPQFCILWFDRFRIVQQSIWIFLQNIISLY